MPDSDHVSQLIAQFDDSADKPAVWRALDLVLPTSAFLNLGYSRWYQSHLVGNPQQRLVSLVLRELMAMRQHQLGSRVLDVGCGRGGAAQWITESNDFEVFGVDLVPFNIRLARIHKADSSSGGGFVVGDAARLPFTAGSMPSVMSIDSIVYMPDKPGVFGELARVLESDGIGVLTDLVIDPVAGSEFAVSAFSSAWGMADLVTEESYRSMLADAGLVVESVTELTRGSVGRFKKWTRLFLGLLETPVRGLMVRVLRRYHIALSELVAQVRTAHAVLDSLRHILVRFRTPPGR